MAKRKSKRQIYESAARAENKKQQPWHRSPADVARLAKAVEQTNALIAAVTIAAHRRLKQIEIDLRKHR